MPNLESKYKILPEHNLVLEFHRGMIDLISYIEFKKKLIRDSRFKPNLYHFIHFKNTIFKTNPKHVSEFYAFMKKNEAIIGENRRVAFVTETPNQVVTTTLYKMTQQNTNKCILVFSTNKSALKWLGVPDIANESIINTYLEIENK